MNNIKYGNIYFYDPNEKLEKQIEECAKHMFAKYNDKPDVAFFHPVNVGEKEIIYKTREGREIKIIPDATQLTKSFVLGVTGP